jgi:hypothetical protein
MDPWRILQLTGSFIGGSIALPVRITLHVWAASHGEELVYTHTPAPCKIPTPYVWSAVSYREVRRSQSAPEVEDEGRAGERELPDGDAGGPEHHGPPSLLQRPVHLQHLRRRRTGPVNTCSMFVYGGVEVNCLSSAPAFIWPVNWSGFVHHGDNGVRNAV